MAHEEATALSDLHAIGGRIVPLDKQSLLGTLHDRAQELLLTDFSVLLFRPNFMLTSEEHPMKAHKNQGLLTTPSSPVIPCGATNQGTHHGVCGADAFAVTWEGTIPRDVGLQLLENKALSRGTVRKAACILAEITVRKSQGKRTCEYPLALDVLFLQWAGKRLECGILTY
jgi:hypothetical protein